MHQFVQASQEELRRERGVVSWSGTSALPAEWPQVARWKRDGCWKTHSLSPQPACSADICASLRQHVGVVENRLHEVEMRLLVFHTATTDWSVYYRPFWSHSPWADLPSLGQLVADRANAQMLSSLHFTAEWWYIFTEMMGRTPQLCSPVLLSSTPIQRNRRTVYDLAELNCFVVGNCIATGYVCSSSIGERVRFIFQLCLCAKEIQRHELYTGSLSPQYVHYTLVILNAAVCSSKITLAEAL